MPLSEVKIPAQDRGFLLGDAVYEVLRVYQGQPWLANEHIARLKQSLAAIRILGVDVDRLRLRMQETIAAGSFLEATVYIQVTRGVAPRSHQFPANIKPLEFLSVQCFQDTYAEPRRSGAAVITLPDIRWGRCDIKSTNLLANVLAMQAATEAGCHEAIMFMPDDTLTEGTHTSFFGVQNSSVLTPPNSNAILPGITRSLMLRLSKRAGIPVREEVLKRSDLTKLSEVFLTGTTSEVLPVVKVNGALIGNGQPGQIVRRLQTAYAEAVTEFLTEKRASV